VLGEAFVNGIRQPGSMPEFERETQIVRKKGQIVFETLRRI